MDHFGAVYCILISTEGFGSSTIRGQSDNKTFKMHLNYTEIVPTLSWDALALAKFIRSFIRLNSIKMKTGNVIQWAFSTRYIYTPSVFCYDKHKKNFDIQFSLKRHEAV